MAPLQRERCFRLTPNSVSASVVFRVQDCAAWQYYLCSIHKGRLRAWSWPGSRSSVVRALAAQATNLGLIPNNSLPFILPYIQPGLLEHHIQCILLLNIAA